MKANQYLRAGPFLRLTECPGQGLPSTVSCSKARAPRRRAAVLRVGSLAHLPQAAEPQALQGDGQPVVVVVVKEGLQAGRAGAAGGQRAGGRWMALHDTLPSCSRAAEAREPALAAKTSVAEHRRGAPGRAGLCSGWRGAQTHHPPHLYALPADQDAAQSAARRGFSPGLGMAPEPGGREPARELGAGERWDAPSAPPQTSWRAAWLSPTRYSGICVVKRARKRISRLPRAKF